MKLIDYIFLMRPMLIIPVWTISLLGARAAQWQQRGLNPFTLDRFPFVNFSSSDLHLLILLLVGTLLSGGIFIVNQIYDIESDRVNKKLFLLPEGHVSITEAWVLYYVTTAGALIGAFILSWQLGILFVLGALIGLQYSLPRFNLKEHPYKAFRNNVIGHGMLIFLCGWVLYSNFDIEGIVKSLPYVLAVGAVYLNTTLPDTHGDKAVGKKTYALEWGVGRTLRISFTLVAVSALLSILFADYGFAISATISSIAFAIAWQRESVKTASLVTKISILLLSLFAAIYYPPYFVVLVLTIVLTRLYYATKFSLNYPALISDEK